MDQRGIALSEEYSDEDCELTPSFSNFDSIKTKEEAKTLDFSLIEDFFSLKVEEKEAKEESEQKLTPEKDKPRNTLPRFLPTLEELGSEKKLAKVIESLKDELRRLQEKLRIK